MYFLAKPRYRTLVKLGRRGRGADPVIPEHLEPGLAEVGVHVGPEVELALDFALVALGVLLAAEGLGPCTTRRISPVDPV